MADAIVSTLSEKLTSMLADKIFQEVSLVTNFRDDLETICDELDSIKTMLNDVREMTNSRSTTNWLHKVQDFLYRAVCIVEECEAGNFRNPFFRYGMGRKIKTLKKYISNIHSRAKYLKYVSMVDVNARLHASNANSEDKRKKSSAVLTEFRTVGMEKEAKLITGWIMQEGYTVIAVVGIGGLGKTLVVQKVLDNPIVKQRFDYTVWLAASQKYIERELLVEMGKQIKIPSEEDLSGLPAEKLREIIHKHLANKCCMLVLDDVWEQGALNKIELPFMNNGNNKIVVTTRDKRVGESMSAHHSHEMKCLSVKKSLKLFYIHAFPDRQNNPPSEEMKLVSRRIVQKCGGLPLAIKTIAASLARVPRIPNKWEYTLERLNQAEALTGTVMPSLRLSYHALPSYLKACFLYCSIFPKNAAMRSQYLVYSWIAEGFVSTQLAAEAYDIGLSYIQELADRCLIEVSKVGGDGRIKYCKIHALLHDLVLSESRDGTKCLLKPEEDLKEFPANECMGVRRISLVKNNINSIKDAIECPDLRTLLLWNNIHLSKISTRFFNKLTYMAVLDLSQTSIKALPRSIGHLKNLKFLNLSRTNIENLPNSLSGLCRLQFLDVSWCKDLISLHSGIGNHKSMLHLNVKHCSKLESLPPGLEKLSSLQTLKGAIFRTEKHLAHLKQLNLLQHLSLAIGAPSSSQAPQEPASLSHCNFKIDSGIFKGMTKLRTISLRSKSSCRLDLPDDMESISQRLEHVRLHNCSMPKWIFKLENLMVLVLDGDMSGADYEGLGKIPNLIKLRLSRNKKCEQFPEEFGASTAFPNLKKLIIEEFNCSKQFPILQDNTMPNLQYLRVRKCNYTEDILREFSKLKTLNEVELEKEDLRHWQISKDRPVKIKAIDPQEEKEIEKMVKEYAKDELEKREKEESNRTPRRSISSKVLAKLDPCRTMSGPRVLSPLEEDGVCQEAG